LGYAKIGYIVVKSVIRKKMILLVSSVRTSKNQPKNPVKLNKLISRRKEI